MHASPGLSRAERVHLVLSAPSTCRAARGVSLVIMVLIVLSVVAFVLETMPALKLARDDGLERLPNPVFQTIECAAARARRRLAPPPPPPPPAPPLSPPSPPRLRGSAPGRERGGAGDIRS